ncbi:MAG: hypothetical protein ER33_11880 [Cyanobium sp. CACIAM 14]|nr:MAG: hypothetical protein ER33_11880 [Cyanobium sp. CACIAM 14]
MAMVILVLLSLILGTVAIAGRTTGGLLGANLQSRNREARDVAEAGIVEIVAELNKEQNRALLVAGNTGAWDSTQVNPCTKYNPTTNVYSSTSAGTPPTTTATNYKAGGWTNLSGSTTQQFQLESVTYSDTASVAYDTPSNDIKVTGVSKSVVSFTVNGRVVDAAGNVLSTSRVTRKFLVVPKCCRRSFGLNQFGATSFGPDSRVCLSKSTNGTGIITSINGGTISSSNSNITIRNEAGDPISSVICRSNSSPVNSNCTGNSLTVGRNVSAVPTSFNLTLPTFPSALGISTWGSVPSTRSYIGVVGGQVQACSSASNCQPITDPAGNNVCGLSSGQYYCRLSTINSSNSNLRVDTSNGPINFYFDSPSATSSTDYIALGGNGTITQVNCGSGSGGFGCNTNASLTANADNLNLFAPSDPAQPSVGTGQFNLRGGSGGFLVNVYAPKASVALNGNADFNGRLWVNSLDTRGLTNSTLVVTNAAPGFCSQPGVVCPSNPFPSTPDIDWVARSVVQSSAF